MRYLFAITCFAIPACFTVAAFAAEIEKPKAEPLTHEEALAAFSRLLLSTPPGERNIYSPETSYRYTDRETGEVVKETIEMAGKPFRSSSEFCRFYSLKVNRPWAPCADFLCARKVDDSYRLESVAWIRREEKLECALDDLSAQRLSSPSYSRLSEDMPDNDVSRLFTLFDDVLADMDKSENQQMAQPYSDFASRNKTAILRLRDAGCQLTRQGRSSPDGFMTPHYVGQNRWMAGAFFMYADCSKRDVRTVALRALMGKGWNLLAYDILLNETEWPPAPWSENNDDHH